MTARKMSNEYLRKGRFLRKRKMKKETYDTEHYNNTSSSINNSLNLNNWKRIFCNGPNKEIIES